jgi:hypothetical protein
MQDPQYMDAWVLLTGTKKWALSPIVPPAKLNL